MPVKHFRNHLLHHKYIRKDLPIGEPTELTRFQCSECFEECHTLVDYENHIKSHQKSSKNDLECDECGKICKDKNHYKNHRTHHKKLKNCEKGNCSKCNKEMPKTYLQRHESKCTIKSDPEFKCEECGKQCRDLKHFTNHNLYHKYSTHPGTGGIDGPHKKG